MGNSILSRNNSWWAERIGGICLSTSESLGEKWVLADGAPGKPTSFGDLLCANGGFMNESSTGLTVDIKQYGYGGELPTDGVCIIEWKEPIWGK